MRLRNRCKTRIIERVLNCVGGRRAFHIAARVNVYLKRLLDFALMR